MFSIIIIFFLFYGARDQTKAKVLHILDNCSITYVSSTPKLYTQVLEGLEKHSNSPACLQELKSHCQGGCLGQTSWEGGTLNAVITIATLDCQVTIHASIKELTERTPYLPREPQLSLIPSVHRTFSSHFPSFLPSIHLGPVLSTLLQSLQYSKTRVYLCVWPSMLRARLIHIWFQNKFSFVRSR